MAEGKAFEELVKDADRSASDVIRRLLRREMIAKGLLEEDAAERPPDVQPARSAPPEGRPAAAGKAKK